MDHSSISGMIKSFPSGFKEPCRKGGREFKRERERRWRTQKRKGKIESQKKKKR